MKKLYSMLFLGLLLLMSSCQKDEIQIPADPCSDSFKSSSAITMTITLLNNRNLNPGSTFNFEIKILNGSTPSANTSVGIEDPIKMMCTARTTNSLGKATYTCTTSSTTTRMAYTFKFLYGSMVVYSTVAINPSGATALSTYTIDFNNVTSLGSSTLVGTSRGDIQTTAQPQSTTLQQAVTLGVDVAKDYHKNPGNLLIASVAVVTCSAGQSIPAAGQAACAVTAKMVAAGVAASTVNVLTKAAIDKNSSWSASTKTSLKAIVDLSCTAISVSRLAPAEGLKALGNLPTIHDLLTTNYGALINNASGILKGASVSLPLSGTDECINISFYNREFEKEKLLGIIV